MATSSFDVSTGADLQEVDNAVNQALKELSQRYDFKGTNCTIEFDREKAAIKLGADDAFRMQQLVEIVRGRLAKRGIPAKNIGWGEDELGAGTSVRRTVTLTQGIPTEAAKKIVKSLKEGGFKKVTAAIQGDEVRVSSPSRDDLQAVIAYLRAQDFEIELKFGNYRG